MNEYEHEFPIDPGEYGVDSGWCPICHISELVTAWYWRRFEDRIPLLIRSEELVQEDDEHFLFWFCSMCGYAFDGEGNFYGDEHRREYYEED